MASFDQNIAGALGNTNAAPDIQDQTGRPDTVTLPASTRPPQPTAPAAPQQAQPAQEPQPPALIHPNHRSFFGAVASALVGGTLAAASKTAKAVAGPQPVQYTTDANGRVIPDPNQKPDTTSSRLERIARAALEGLAAGAMVPSGPNRGAQLARGIGAGFGAQQAQAQEQNLLERQQAQQDYEEQQKATLHKASLALTNAQTLNLWQKIADDENAKDAERTKNMGIVNDLNEYISQNPQSSWPCKQ